MPRNRSCCIARFYFVFFLIPFGASCTYEYARRCLYGQMTWRCPAGAFGLSLSLFLLFCMPFARSAPGIHMKIMQQSVHLARGSLFCFVCVLLGQWFNMCHFAPRWCARLSVGHQTSTTATWSSSFIMSQEMCRVERKNRYIYTQFNVIIRIKAYFGASHVACPSCPHVYGMRVCNITKSQCSKQVFHYSKRINFIDVFPMFLLFSVLLVLQIHKYRRE